MNEAQKAQERREAREKGKATNAQAAIDQEFNLAALHDRLVRQAKGEETDADREDGIAEKRSPPPAPVARKDMRAAQQIVAAKQAERDAQATVAPLVEEPVNLAAYTSKGLEPPLHVLNALARRADNAIRDEARDVAQVVGKAAFDELSGRRKAGHESRQRSVTEAMRAMEKQKAMVNQKTV